MTNSPLNIPNPDPSVIANERLKEALVLVNTTMARNHVETRGWVDSLQILQESNLRGAVKILETRLNGNDTALVAALQAQKEAAQKQTDSFAAILSESKSGSTKQIDGLNEKIDDLKERMSESGGKSQGIGQALTMIIAAIAMVAAVTSVSVVLFRQL